MPNYVTMAAPESTPILELEKKRKRRFWFWKWDSADITNLCLIIVKHVLGCCAPFVFDWGAFWVALVLGIFTGLGVTLGYHRLLTPRSFKIPKWLEYFFVYCGVHGGQVGGDVNLGRGLAFPKSGRHGLELWQFDFTWLDWQQILRLQPRPIQKEWHCVEPPPNIRVCNGFFTRSNSSLYN